MNTAVQSVAEFNHEVHGTMSFGTGATACIHLLPPLLCHLREKHPLLTVGVTTGNTLDIVRAVEESRLDLGLVTLPASGRPGGNASAGGKFVFITANDDEPLVGQLTPSLLQALSLIAFEAGSGTRELIDGWFRAAGVNSAPVMQLGSIEAIKRMVRAGLGYSIVPKMAVAAEDDRTGIRVQSLSPRLYRQLGVVMRQDKVINKGIAEMLRLLHQLKILP